MFAHEPQEIPAVDSEVLGDCRHVSMEPFHEGGDHLLLPLIDQVLFLVSQKAHKNTTTLLPQAEALPRGPQHPEAS